VTVVALSTAESVLALIGLTIGVVVLVVVIGLFNRIMRPAGEIRSYADDILEAGVGIGRNLDGVDELRTTHALGSAVPGLAGAYLKKLGGGP
jgi:hypothetical protein